MARTFHVKSLLDRGHPYKDLPGFSDPEMLVECLARLGRIEPVEVDPDVRPTGDLGTFDMKKLEAEFEWAKNWGLGRKGEKKMMPHQIVGK